MVTFRNIHNRFRHIYCSTYKVSSYFGYSNYPNIAAVGSRRMPRPITPDIMLHTPSIAMPLLIAWAGGFGASEKRAAAK